MTKKVCKKVTDNGVRLADVRSSGAFGSPKAQRAPLEVFALGAFGLPSVPDFNICCNCTPHCPELYRNILYRSLFRGDWRSGAYFSYRLELPPLETSLAKIQIRGGDSPKMAAEPSSRNHEERAPLQCHFRTIPTVKLAIVAEGLHQCGESFSFAYFSFWTQKEK